jgi:methionyl-tRNA synthetase
MEVVLFTLLETLKQIAIILQPFIPSTSEYILNHLSIPNDFRQLKSINIIISGNNDISVPSILFPRI